MTDMQTPFHTWAELESTMIAVPVPCSLGGSTYTVYVHHGKVAIVLLQLSEVPSALGL